MRRALAAVAVLAAVGCKQEPARDMATALVDWVQQSPDGRFELRQQRDQERVSCRVQTVVKSGDGERSLWTSQTCLPTSGLAFLSPNGEKVLVLDLYPSGQPSPDWSRLPLISLWERGAVVHQYTGGEILGPVQSASSGRSLSWVRGETYDQNRAAARASPDGARVSIALTDGRTLMLGFDGGPLPAPPPPAAEPARAVEEPVARQPEPPPPPKLEEAPASGRAPEPLAAYDSTLYRWEDEAGEVHFGTGSQIPDKFRKKARPVSGSVGVIPAEKIESLPSPGGAQPSPGAPGAPGAPAEGEALPPAPQGSTPLPTTPR
jgi:hypothetical protein